MTDAAATTILVAPSSIDCSTLWTLKRGLLMHLACQLSTIRNEEKGPVAPESSGPMRSAVAGFQGERFSMRACRGDIVDRLFERVDGPIEIGVLDDKRWRDLDA